MLRQRDDPDLRHWKLILQKDRAKAVTGHKLIDLSKIRIRGQRNARSGFQEVAQDIAAANFMDHPGRESAPGAELLQKTAIEPRSLAYERL